MSGVVLSGSNALIIGGFTGAFLDTTYSLSLLTHDITNIVERYDPVANTWSNVTGMNNARGEFAIAAFGSNIYVFGGQSGNGIAYVKVTYFRCQYQ